ncbi:lamin tail domain-containing protein [Stenotrophomonas sp. MMGLT7]|uniref:lamin tail domain-containing protein n=1 Tax=Stenotrophomonas sp. MMGLT7 TaxID=2901227 RepID=UPI001E2A30FA|nr:lamin tail domain-containing protein [Stenotrophomonas sp. MMGLT7]MCD7097974.1 DUF11 domain-containing protein [Stenotrophomonas sp. MMGLT7]
MRSMQFRAALLACVLSPCVLALAGQAQAQVVISQVYGGGGNSGATYRSDFVELHNNGTQAVDLSGWSLQYASAAGSSWQVTPLAGSIAAGGYYLVKQADGSGGSADLPAADATGTIAMSATAGKVALSSSAAALSGTCPTGNVDFVGFGSTASCAEGSSRAPAPSNALAIARGEGGCSDSDDNAADFATASPEPRNGAATPRLCAGGGAIIATLGDVRRAEGDAGTTDFVFTLALSEPAPEGGIGFNVATADGSASAGSDYDALATTAMTIAAGQSSASIVVKVHGDTVAEPDETFALRVSDIAGALPASLEATATIVNDDFQLLPIHAIQGSGARSPLEGQVVAASGIVTARRGNGFFMQAPDAEADADPLTSEGIFVYLGSAPPEDAAVGNRVKVQGTVLEYVPSADPAQPPLTEIGGAPTVILQSTGHALPAPVALTAQFPDADGAYDQLERLEGMRVTAASLTVNTPTAGNVSEATATATSNGVFHAVVTGVPRAWRGPGVQQPDPLPAGSPAGVPRWNTNPQVIAVASAGLGGERLDLAAGCVVTGVTGPLDYSYRRYTLYPETTPAFSCAEATRPRPAPQPQADDVSVASYNLERFFDDQNDPAIGEPVLSPAAYQGRLNKASLAVRDFLHLPDILGVAEVENLQVLQTLAARIGTDAVAAGQPDPGYAAYLLEGNDVGGIDVGFLVRTAEVGAGLARVQVEEVEQIGKDTTWTEPAGGVSLLNDRPPLLLKAKVNFADGRQLPLTVVAVHQRSLNGAETDDASGQRIRAKRQAQAEFLANLLQARQAADPAEQVLVLGDFNAFEFNDGYVDAMGTVTGRPSPDAQTVVAGDGADLVDPDYTDLTWMLPPDQSYSYAYDGNVQSLDHIVASQALLESPQLATLVYGHARINADQPEIARNDAGSAARLSDHDPALVLLRLKLQRFADLGLAANADRAQVAAGGTIGYTVDVDNHGPDAAEHAAVAFVFDAAVQPQVGAPEGWSCSEPGGTTTVTCTIARLGSGAAQRFVLQVPTDSALAGRSLSMAASVKSQTPDPQAGNDNAAVGVEVEADRAGNLSLRIDGPRQLPWYALRADYRLVLSNLGERGAEGAQLRIDGSTLAGLASVQAPAGWRCVKTSLSALRPLGYLCSAAAALAPGNTTTFGVRVNRFPALAGGAINLQAAASSSTADSDASDNDASAETRVCSWRGC